MQTQRRENEKVRGTKKDRCNNMHTRASQYKRRGVRHMQRDHPKNRDYQVLLLEKCRVYA